MTENENKPILSEVLSGLPTFVRLRTARLVDKILGDWSWYPDDTRVVAEAIHAAFKDGHEHGEREALYDSPPKDFASAKVVDLHKVRDLRILELVYEGQKVFTARVDEHQWGAMHTEFDAALVDALGYKYGDKDRNDDPGYFANRVLNIPNGRGEQ